MRSDDIVEMPDIYAIWDAGLGTVTMYETCSDGEWTTTKDMREFMGMTAAARSLHPSHTAEARYEWVMTHDDAAPSFAILKECAEAAIGFGLQPDHVDWDRFYDALESFGWDTIMAGVADERIRRIVRKARREGEIQ